MNTLDKWSGKIKGFFYLFRPADVIIILLAILAVSSSFRIWQQAGRGQRVQIYQEGKLYQEIDLSVHKTIRVKGPLGITAIEIQSGRTRIVADPSPRQYCVQKGWLQKVGQMAICLPNHTSIVIVGRDQEVGYDSLTY